MRILGWALVSLIFVNAGVFGRRHSLSEERAVLVELASERSREDANARASLERDRALGALVSKARKTARTPRDIGELREMLLSAEDGLQIERLSLDFRPAERVPAGFGGSRVETSLEGSFDALYEYLARVEAMFMPLSIENLALRGDGSRRTLIVRWAARWPLEGAAASAAGAELTTSELSHLSEWLSRESSPGPERDLFAFSEAQVPVEPAPVVAAPKLPVQQPTLGTAAEQPVLTGFVLARPELEPDIRRRVLAALRYGGEVHLLMVGDSVGAYRIDSMQARDSVTLQHAETGERIRLTLE